jgi:RNA-directed DNA polymerase
LKTGRQSSGDASSGTSSACNNAIYGNTACSLAERRGDYEQVHNLQRLLLRSWSARCLAVRRVSQDNRGKRTPGVDGIANLSLKQRLALIEELRNVSNWQADAIRRTYIDKRGTTEKRGLGIPMLHSHCTSYNRL